MKRWRLRKKAAVMLLTCTFAVIQAASVKADVGTEEWSTVFYSSVSEYNAAFYGVDFLDDDTLFTAGRETDVAGNNWAGMGIRYTTGDGTPLDDPPEWIRYTHADGTLFKAQAIGAGGDIYFIGDEYGGNTGAVWKYGSDGTLGAGWPKYTPNLSFLEGIAVDSGGSLYVVGAFATPYHWEAAARDWLIYKYESDGSVAAGFPLPWYDHAGFFDRAYRVAVDSEDNFIVIGLISQTEDNRDWLIRKYKASDRTVIWEKTVDGNGFHDYARAILIDSDDNIIVSGDKNNGTDNGDNAAYDAYIVKFAKGDGTILWEQTWDSGGNDYAEEMAPDSKGNLYIAGRTANADGNLRAMVQYRDGETGELLKSQDISHVTTHNNSPADEGQSGVYIALRNGQLAVASSIWETADPVPPYRQTACITMLELLSDITPSVTGKGTIDPSGKVENIDYNTTADFTLVPSDGQKVIDVGGSCPDGSLTDNGDGSWNYTTGAITEDCEVVANFTNYIVIDPGAVGSSFKEMTFTFDDLNGRNADPIGPLEFVFADGKHGTIALRSDVTFDAVLSITFSESLTTGFVPATSGSLRYGESLLANNSQGSAGGGFTDTYNVHWQNWDVPEIDGFTFSNVHFNSVRFRDYPDSATIVSATLKLYVWGSVHDGTVEIGSDSSFPWNLFLPAMLGFGQP